ncbi:MAG: GNAT family N-acetyltransferase [Gemmatimonadales bacterium]
MSLLPDLADAADANLAAHAILPCRVLPGARVWADEALTVVDSGLPCDTFNLICRSRLRAEAAAQRIADALAYYQETQHPFSWWLGPGAQPDDLPRYLEAAGLVPAESELAMGLDLTELAGVELPAGLSVRRVTTAGELEEFAQLSAANWSPPDPHVLAFYRAAAPHFLAPDAPQWLYLGYNADTPVATAELTRTGTMAGLYNIATRPDHRGRGIGTAMTWTPLRDASRAGLTHAILQAAPMGQRLYARLGFQAFGAITEWKLHA